jgi:TonB family protein
MAILMLASQLSAPARGQPSSPKGTPAAGQTRLQRAYLARVHKLFKDTWQKTLTDAGALLPPSHPANDPKRMVELEVDLDRRARITVVRVVKPSGFPPFDESASITVKRLKRLPPLPPELARYNVRLRWRFYRDKRACDPRFARVLLIPFTPPQALRRALRKGQLDRARQILERSSTLMELYSILADHALKSKDPQLLPLIMDVVPRDRLLRIVRRGRGTARKLAALQALARRQGQAGLPQELHGWLNAQRRPELVVAAARMVRKSLELDRLLSKWEVADTGKEDAQNWRVLGPLAVYRLAVGPTSRAESLLKRALAGPRPGPALEAIGDAGLASAAKQVEAVVRDRKAPREARVAAIGALGRLQGSPVPLYAALKSKDPEVLIAAARALGQFHGSRKGISFRLNHLAFNASREVATEALVAMARLGDPRFKLEVYRLASGMKPEHQARVAAAMWGFGAPALKVLEKMLGHDDRRVRRAALSSLRRLDAPRARELVQKHGQAGDADDSSGLAGLLRHAARLRKEAETPVKIKRPTWISG